jgi:3-methyladenine DNA glycosylase AlkD
MTAADKITKQLKAMGRKAAAEHAQRFFKTGPGEYGEGDLFLGITVPVLRKLAKEFTNGKTVSPTPASRLRQASARQVDHPSGGGDSLKSPPLEGCRNGGVVLVDISLTNAVELLQSPLHEVRLLALLIMVLQAKQNSTAVYRAYLANTHRINNWDLVDCSAEHIVGAHLFDRDHLIDETSSSPAIVERASRIRERVAVQKHRLPGVPGKPVPQETAETSESLTVLTKLAKSKSLWERRIAIIATFYFIRRNQFDDTLALADILLNDKEDLLHKAVGWMLREVGKRDPRVEEEFLLPRYQNMPRTMLRYAIECFPEPKRLAYLKGSL